MKRISTITIVGFFIIFFLSGCIHLLGPHSISYQPTTWEKEEFEKADFSVYPDDTRKEITKYKSTIIAWPGIILERKIIEHSDRTEMVFLLEHHYYDWIEDYSVQREKILLSSRGEGLFKTSLFSKEPLDPATIKETKEAFAIGGLLIIYGIPEKIIENEVVVVRCTAKRYIDKQWYTTKSWLDYGRIR